MKFIKYFFVLLICFVLLGAGVYFWFPGVIVKSGIHLSRWNAGLKRYEVQVDDHNWVYLAGGEGEPIIYLHGFGANKDSWLMFLKGFNKSYQFIVPDLPGFGESSRISSSAYDVPSQAERLNRFVEELKLDSFHLAGNSMGGYIAGYYAVEYPDKINKLILLDPAGIISRVPSDFKKQFQGKEGPIFCMKTPEDFKESTKFFFYQPQKMPAPFLKYFAKESDRFCEFNQKIFEDIRGKGDNLLDGRLSRIKAKTLVIWGENDRMIHVSSTEKFQEGIKDCRVVIIKECGHLPQMEKTAEVQAVIQKFLPSL